MVTTYREKVFAFVGLVGAIVWLSPDSLLVRLYTCDAVTQLFYKNIFFSLAIVPVLIAVKGGLRNALRALGLDVTTNESARVLARYDADESGVLEHGEFKKLVLELQTLEHGASQP